MNVFTSANDNDCNDSFDELPIVLYRRRRDCDFIQNLSITESFFQHNLILEELLGASILSIIWKNKEAGVDVVSLFDEYGESIIRV